jgi:hypothetical protein
LELAAIADTVYGVTTNITHNTDSCYKSVDGGVTWVKQNTTILPAGLGSGQGWYNLTLTSIQEIQMNCFVVVWMHTDQQTVELHGHAIHFGLLLLLMFTPISISCNGGIKMVKAGYLSDVMVAYVSYEDNGVTWKDKNREFGY